MVKVTLDIPEGHTFLGYYTRHDGINEYHNAADITQITTEHNITKENIANAIKDLGNNIKY